MAVSPQPALYPTGNDAATSAAIALLIHYFDLAPASAQLLVKKWLTNYPAIWIRAAVTEALYQGRYKPFSVEQILAFWQRRGKSIPHFNKEFETIIAVPLQGSFKTETDVAIEGNSELESDTAAMATTKSVTSQAIGAEPALAPGTTLAEALEAAEQEQLIETTTPLPRPRLMLPGELPGKGLAQQKALATDDAAAEGPASETAQVSETAQSHRDSANSLEDSKPKLTGASALSQPQGFDGIIDPRPRPQITQGPDSALVAEAKSKPIQPPPIGRFTPAADPSGFASRLKTVVEQAIAKTQSQKEAQLSLETAIASQLASDPVLGQPDTEVPSTQTDSGPASELASEAIKEVEVITPQNQAADALEAVPDSTQPAEEAQDPLMSLEVPAVEEAQLTQDVTNQENDSGATESIAVAEPISSKNIESEITGSERPEPPEPLESDADPEPEQPTDSDLTEPNALQDAETDAPATESDDPAPGEVTIAQEPETPNQQNPESSPEITAPFEDRFPLTNASETSFEKVSEKPRDAIDIELDNRLIETPLDEEPIISLTPTDNDRLDLVFESDPIPPVEAPRNSFQDEIEADEAALLAQTNEGKLLSGEALDRHLEAGFEGQMLEGETDGSIASSQTSDETNQITASLAERIATADSSIHTEDQALFAQADSSTADQTNQDSGPSEQVSPAREPEITAQQAAPNPLLPESTREMSQVSNLMAGLTQLNNANLYTDLSLPSINAMEPEPAQDDSDTPSPEHPQTS